MTSTIIHGKPKPKSTGISRAARKAMAGTGIKGVKLGESQVRRGRPPPSIPRKTYGASSSSKALRAALAAKEQELEAKDRALTAALQQIEMLRNATVPEAAPTPTDDDLSANSEYLIAKTRAMGLRRALVDAGQLLTSGDLAGRMGITRQALSKAVNDNRLFALQLQDDQFYPAFFADEHISRATFGRICKVLGDIDAWEKFMFFTRPNGALAKRTPLQALQHDQIDAVLTAAAAFAG